MKLFRLVRKEPFIYDTILADVQNIRIQYESGVLPLLKPLEQHSLWGKLILDILKLLSEQGRSVVPTLKRFEKMLRTRMQFEKKTLSKTAQAKLQGWEIMGMIPLISAALYFFVEERIPYLFFMFALMGLLFGIGGHLWIQSLATKAALGGIYDKKLPSSAFAFGEGVYAFIVSGCAADLAYTQVKALMKQSGYLTLFQSESSPQDLFFKFTEELRRAVLISVMEGRPCLDRISSLIDTLEMDYQSLIEKEIELLPTQCLKPLFLCMMPGIIVQIFGTLFLELWFL